MSEQPFSRGDYVSADEILASCVFAPTRLVGQLVKFRQAVRIAGLHRISRKLLRSLQGIHAAVENFFGYDLCEPEDGLLAVANLNDADFINRIEKKVAYVP